MTFLSLPTALLLTALATLALVFAGINPPPNPRLLYFLAGVLGVLAIVVTLVVALR